jgi:hypothetical protein
VVYSGWRTSAALLLTSLGEPDPVAQHDNGALPASEPLQRGDQGQPLVWRPVASVLWTGVR